MAPVCHSGSMRCLLFVDSAGALVLGDVDSGVNVPIGEQPAGVDARVTTAVWSAQGQWTAWAVDAPAADGVHELRVHDEATDITRVLAESLGAFYLCPSPCGRYLSHLSPGPLGLELGVSDVRTGELTIIERGQPLFWSWSPDSTHLAVHVEHRVLVVSADGSDRLVLSEDAGRFITPWWMPGDAIAFVVDDRIVSGSANRGPATRQTTVLADSGNGRFAIDPDARRLALFDRIDGRASLVVHDLLTDARSVVTTEQVAAFFWSPDGRALAVLVLASSTEFQWLVHDGTELVRLQAFRPSRAWLSSVIPFFEQYTLSHPVWSSDGRSLVAPSLDSDGLASAMVQSVEPPFTVERLAGADLVWWAAG